MGENVARYAKKGNKVAVVGSVELRNYEDSQGVRRTAVDINCNDVEFLTPRAQSGDSGYESDIPSSAPSHSERRKPTLQSFDDDGDIPF